MWSLFGPLLLSAFVQAQPASADLRQEARNALKKAVAYYRTHAASHGGYVYYYRLDLKERWGEGRADDHTIFVQPPGTPTVGLAYLRAFAATGEPYYLDAAREAAEALIQGQLQSGGWTQVIHFGPAKRLGKYRTRQGGNWNASSLDDDQTQAALRLLIRTDQATHFKDQRLHEAVRYGLDGLLKAQFPSGGFPQVWTQAVAAKPVVQAQYPDYDWKTQGKVRNYWDYCTLNDNLAGTVADTLMAAHQVYREEKYRAALEKLGDFLILAQMPDPQPAWCQQYNDAMMPMWGRKFEPPAITGWESQDALTTLIHIARHTGNKKYLKPVPKALAYLRKSLLPQGQLARYYELKTNKPLYMDAQYQLTYDDSAVPSHYGWKQPSRLQQIVQELEQIRSGTRPKPTVRTTDLAARVRKTLAALDSQGRWISEHSGERLVGQPPFAKGFRYLSSAVFSHQVETLSEFLLATKD